MGRTIKMAESPMEGHPDKLADLIADALLDEFIRKDPYSRVSLEILLISGMTLVAGHVSTESYVDIPGIAHHGGSISRTLGGYTQNNVWTLFFYGG